jgi:hypothetical protein
MLRYTYIACIVCHVFRIVRFMAYITTEIRLLLDDIL